MTGHFDQRLTTEQLLDVLGHARASSERDFLMILIAVSHGLRASECCFLTTANFDLTEGEITVRRGKGSNKTCQPLVSHDNPLLDEHSAVTSYLRGRQNGRLFQHRTADVRFAFQKVLQTSWCACEIAASAYPQAHYSARRA
jgi:integrase